MATLVHLTPEKNASRMLRRGINVGRGIFCMPVLPHYYSTHQWVRELKRQGQRSIAAIYFQVPADEVVLVGHFGQPHQEVTVGAAIKAVMDSGDGLGFEIIVQRAIAADEILRIRRPSQVLGWRYSPTAKGRVPCGCSYCARGEANSRKRQDAYEPRDPRTYDELLHQLRTLDGAEPQTLPNDNARTRAMAHLLYEIGSRRAGRADDLAFLLKSKDPAVLEALAFTLGRYQGRTGREMLVRLCSHPADNVRRESAMSLLRRPGTAGMMLLEQFAGDPVIAEVVAEHGANP
ncbi:MAG: hypothetical protein JWO42_3967 [Chloroflexi bacterium]|jgi:hypothetical protein|nr:hypothetical protein [Chloroflexota bacterium]